MLASEIPPQELKDDSTNTHKSIQRPRTPSTSTEEHTYGHFIDTPFGRNYNWRARLFVKNTPLSVGESHLRKTFEKYGEILAAVPKGAYCIIQFRHPEEMERALNGEKDLEYDGRPCELSACRPPFDHHRLNNKRRNTSPPPVEPASKEVRLNLDEKPRRMISEPLDVLIIAHIYSRKEFVHQLEDELKKESLKYKLEYIDPNRKSFSDMALSYREKHNIFASIVLMPGDTRKDVVSRIKFFIISENEPLATREVFDFSLKDAMDKLLFYKTRQDNIYKKCPQLMPQTEEHKKEQEVEPKPTTAPANTNTVNSVTPATANAETPVLVNNTIPNNNDQNAFMAQQSQMNQMFSQMPQPNMMNMPFNPNMFYLFQQFMAFMQFQQQMNSNNQNYQMFPMPGMQMGMNYMNSNISDPNRNIMTPNPSYYQPFNPSNMPSYPTMPVQQMPMQPAAQPLPVQTIQQPIQQPIPVMQPVTAPQTPQLVHAQPEPPVIQPQLVVQPPQVSQPQQAVSNGATSDLQQGMPAGFEQFFANFLQKQFGQGQEQPQQQPQVEVKKPEPPAQQVQPQQVAQKTIPQQQPVQPQQVAQKTIPQQQPNQQQTSEQELLQQLIGFLGSKQ